MKSAKGWILRHFAPQNDEITSEQITQKNTGKLTTKKGPFSKVLLNGGERSLGCQMLCEDKCNNYIGKVSLYEIAKIIFMSFCYKIEIIVLFCNKI